MNTKRYNDIQVATSKYQKKEFSVTST